MVLSYYSPAAQLPFGDQFEPGPLQMVGFKAPLGCRGLIKQALEHPPGNPHHAFVFPDANAEFDGRSFGAPAGIRPKAEKTCSTFPILGVSSPFVLAEIKGTVDGARDAAFGFEAVEWHRHGCLRYRCRKGH
jgi:hypothetical protein